MMALCIMCAPTWQGGHQSRGASWQANLKFSDCSGGGHACHGPDSHVIGGLTKGHTRLFEVGPKLVIWFTTIIGA